MPPDDLKSYSIRYITNYWLSVFGTDFPLKITCFFLRIVVLTTVRTASMYLSSFTSLSGLVQWNRFSNNSITQWLIGIFVRSYSSKDYLLMRKRGFLYPQPQTVSQTVWPVRGWDNWKGLGNLFNLSLKIRKRSNFKKLFCLTPIEKATGFGGSYREIIMKKFRIFYQTKLGGLHLMVLL